MALTITVKEEVFGSKITNNLPVPLKSGRLTLAELIEAKVTTKVYALNQDLNVKEATGYFMTPAEKILNEAVIKNQEKKHSARLEALRVDAEKAVYDALAGFQKNAFFVIIDGEQKTSLDEALQLTDRAKVHFIRLLPLVGG